MKKFRKSDIIMIIGSICGIIGGIGRICLAITDRNIPKIFIFIISVCEFAMAFSLIYNYKKSK